MRVYSLAVALLASLALSLAVCLEPWFQSWKGSRTTSDSLLQTALGDGRKLFASHFYAKADAYFHNGYYPTIFDNRDGYAKAHIAADMHKEGEEDEAAENYLGKPRDWIDAFGRHFYPARHTHLGDSGCGHSCCQRAKAGQGHDDDCEHKGHEEGHHEAKRSDEREILPWLRFSAELDPERVETYVVCAYWLRGALKKVDEAEQFLRMGLRANPGDSELLFELGRIYAEDRNDPSRARNVWELGLKNWHRRESSKAEPNVFLHAQLLGYLATLEENQGRFARAIEHLTELKGISPNKEAIQRWIDEIHYEHAP
jgi:tetratricopeptide (TPR) repeat protein